MSVSTLEISRNAEGITIGFRGEQFLGESVTRTLQNELDTILRDRKPDAVWFDLSDVALVSSRMLEVFVNLHNEGIKVVLLNPLDDIRTVIETTRLDTLIEMVDDAA